MVENKYLLLTEFEVRTVSYGPSVFPLKNRGSVTYRTDRENEVSEMVIISLRLIGRAGKEHISNLAGRTVKYGPRNWPIRSHVLTERFNKSSS